MLKGHVKRSSGAMEEWSSEVRSKSTHLSLIVIHLASIEVGLATRAMDEQPAPIRLLIERRAHP